MSDSNIHDVCPLDELVDIVDSEWIGEQVAEDEIDIADLLKSSMREASLEGTLSTHHHMIGTSNNNSNNNNNIGAEQDVLIFLGNGDGDDDNEDNDDQNNASMNGDDDSLLDGNASQMGDSPPGGDGTGGDGWKNGNRRANWIPGQTRQWGELDLEAFHTAYESD